MNIRHLLLACLFFGLIGTAAAQKKEVCFFVVLKFNGTDTEVKSIQGLEGIFLTRFSGKLKENFPCAYENDTKVISYMIALERDKQVLGAGSDDWNKSIAEAHNTDYLVSLELGVALGAEFIAYAACFPYRTSDKTPIIRTYTRCKYSTTSGSEMIKASEDLADKLIDGLKKYEICPFTGPVNITKTSALDSTNVQQYLVYCNQMDQQYRKSTDIKNSSYSEWQLEKKGRYRTEGTMTFYATEKSETVENNPCHVCASGREGGRSYTEERSLEVRGSGISHASLYKGEKQDDTRIELVFLGDGTYVIIVKGTSEPVTGNDIVSRHAEGTCDNMPPETKNEPREIKIPLMVVFGPYSGDASDKVLQQKDSKDIKDPISGEKSTYTIDFTLEQQKN